MRSTNRPAPGARPGTLVLDSDVDSTKIRIIRFSPSYVREENVTRPKDIATPDDGETIWIDVQGVGDGRALQVLAERYQIAPLAMEALVNAPQRPKAQLYHSHQLVVVRAAGRPDSPTETRQLGFVVGANYVISIHTDADDVLEPIRQRLNNPQGRLREHGADFLAYAMIDASADTYFPLLEYVSERIEELERRALQDSTQALLEQIQSGKNRLMQLRRVVWAQRETLHALLLDDSPFFGNDARAHLRSTHDHCIQIADMVDVYREAASGLVTTYMSAVAHRSNEIMKVLTMMSSVFVPLTFIAGIYGMNFEHMPELGLRWSYPTVWLMMAATAISMLVFFRRRGWLGSAGLDAAAAASPDATAKQVGRRRVLVLKDRRTERTEAVDAEVNDAELVVAEAA